MNKLLNYFKLFRPASVLAMNVFIFFPILYSTNNISFALVHTLPFIVMISAEIALNDCADIEKDRINKPQRPLVKGNINVNNALNITIAILTLGIVLGCIVYKTSPKRLLCFIAVSIALSCYNIKSKIIPLIKTIITATTTVLALSFVYTFIDIDFSKYFFLGAAFFFILGRELLMDIRDIEGDKLFNYETLAVLCGAIRIRKTALLSLIMSSVCLGIMLIVRFSFMSLLTFGVSTIIEYYCYVKCICANNSQQQNKYILIFWIPIILMLFIQPL